MSEKPTLLVVDDEHNILKSVKRLFFDTEYKVLTASSGEEALRIFEERKIHLVISDYRMPDMNGVEFLHKVKELYPETVRIILSGYADVGAIVDAINDGQVYKFISKPWNDQEFTTTIMRAFEQHNLLKENKELYRTLESRNEELQKLADSLEEQVKERTRDLEVKNMALSITRNILDLLPLGVMGIDSLGIIVYMNNVLRRYIDTGNLGLGIEARGVVDNEILDKFNACIEKHEPLHAEIRKNGVDLICIPLPGNAGAIGVFGHFSKEEDIVSKYRPFLENVEVADAR